VWLLAAILVANVVASVANSPALRYSLLQCANLASAWIIYPVVLTALDSKDDVQEMIDNSLMAASIAAVLAIVAFAAALAGLSVGGADVSRTAAESLTQPFGAFGTMIEPNILGSYCAAHLVLAIGLLSREGPALSAKRRRLARIAAVACSVAVVLAFTRAAWLGAIAGLVILVLADSRSLAARVRVILVPAAVVLAAGLLVLALPGTASAFLRVKITNLVNPQSPTAVLRLLTYSLAFDQTAAHPIIGWGTFTFAPLVAEGADFAQYAGWRSIWITNFLLLALHDTGIIGLVLWIALLGSLLVPGWRASRPTQHAPRDSAVAASLTAALGTLVIPFLLTTGFSLGYPWLLAGILGAHLRVTRKTESE
jgi:O-antigen ligase